MKIHCVSYTEKIKNKKEEENLNSSRCFGVIVLNVRRPGGSRDGEARGRLASIRPRAGTRVIDHPPNSAHGTAVDEMSRWRRSCE